jgi:hypothetical protein
MTTTFIYNLKLVVSWIVTSCCLLHLVRTSSKHNHHSKYEVIRKQGLQTFSGVAVAL